MARCVTYMARIEQLSIQMYLFLMDVVHEHGTVAWIKVWQELHGQLLGSGVRRAGSECWLHMALCGNINRREDFPWHVQVTRQADFLCILKMCVFSENRKL